MTPQEAGEFVCREFDEFIANKRSDTDWHALRHDLLKWFEALDRPLAFEGMLWIFEHERRVQYQELAGYLLSRRNVPLMIPAGQFIRRVAPLLNASSSEVVKYLGDQAGYENVQQELDAIARDPAGAQLSMGLEKMRYWLGVQRRDAAGPME